MSEKPSLAIIGGGVAGIVSAYLLQNKFAVSILEKEAYLGGHTNTIEIQKGPDKGTLVDTGFIVLNDKTYPNLHKFLQLLNTKTRFSDMSFGFMCESSGFQYSGRGLNGLFAQRKNLFSPIHYKFLLEIKRFCQNAKSELESNKLNYEMTLGTYLESYGYSRRLIFDYVIPMGAAIWSAPDQGILDFPALTFLRFFSNHGLLSLKDRPRWQTVVGGSKTYVDSFKANFLGEIKLGNEIKNILRKGEKIQIEFLNGPILEYDKVILAVHADTAYRILGNKTPEEEKLLSVWSYQKNHTILHTDTTLLPNLTAAHASWNYRREIPNTIQSPLSMTYDMNRLQGLKTKEHYLVTLNTNHKIPREKIIFETIYEHPVFDRNAVKTQEALSALNGKSSVYFCGSYMGFGFHEDAVKSAIHTASTLGVPW